MKQLLKNLLSTPRLLRYSTGHRFIFCYHHVNNVIGGVHSPSYTTRTSTFSDHLDVLGHLFKIVPLDELLQPGQLNKGRNHAAITFDDGFRSVHSIARPLLKAKKFPYAVFVNGAAVESGQNWICNLADAPEDMGYRQRLMDATGLSGGQHIKAVDLIMEKGRFTSSFSSAYVRSDPPSGLFMGRTELAGLAAEGVIIGDHSWDHCVMGRCDGPMLEQQVARGRQMIQEITGHAPRHFAIPFGKKEHFGPTTIEALVRHGHEHIYSTNPNKLGRTDEVGGHQMIPRIGLVDNSVQELLFYINRTLVRNYQL